MGIKFRCRGCDKKLHVKAFLAGKRGVCPHCGAKVRIPLASETPGQERVREENGRRITEHTATATENVASTTPASTRSAEAGAVSPAPSDPSPGSAVKRRKSSSSSSGKSSKVQEQDAISEVPEAVWYVRPPSGGQFGPADAEIMRRWLGEGRVSADSLVWREGWDDWKMGDSVFPSLRPSSPQVDGVVGTHLVADNAPADSLQEAFEFNANQPAIRDAKAHASTKANVRNLAIVVGLSVICIGLLVALFLVLQNQ